MHTNLKAADERLRSNTARQLRELPRLLVMVRGSCVAAAFLVLGLVLFIRPFVLKIALVTALEGHSLPAARLVRFLGGDPNMLDNGITQLRSAVQRRDADDVSILLAIGADPNVRDHPDCFFRPPPPSDLGDTVLAYAVYWHEQTVVRLLLEHGADPNAADADGTTALKTARAQDYADTIALLKQFGAR